MYLCIHFLLQQCFSFSIVQNYLVPEYKLEELENSFIPIQYNIGKL